MITNDLDHVRSQMTSIMYDHKWPWLCTITNDLDHIWSQM